MGRHGKRYWRSRLASLSVDHHLLFEPLILERGKGLYLYDTEGRAYLDFFGGISR